MKDFLQKILNRRLGVMLLKFGRQKVDIEGEQCRIVVLSMENNWKAKRMFHKVLRVPEKVPIHIYEGEDNWVLNHLGGYEPRMSGDTCRMYMRFATFYDNEPKSFFWEGIVPSNKFLRKAGFKHTNPEELDYYGLVTGAANVRMVLTEKYSKEKSPHL